VTGYSFFKIFFAKWRKFATTKWWGRNSFSLIKNKLSLKKTLETSWLFQKRLEYCDRIFPLYFVSHILAIFCTQQKRWWQLKEEKVELVTIGTGHIWGDKMIVDDNSKVKAFEPFFSFLGPET
jgi:hypothetical protein